jgi:hypothetical protein
VTCSFRFEARSKDEIVELQAEHYTVKVCIDCQMLSRVHLRIHQMRVEKVIVEMAGLRFLS